MSDKALYSKRDIDDVMDKFGLSRDMSEVALYSRQKFAESFKLLNQYDNESIEPPNRYSLADVENTAFENTMFIDEEERANAGEFDKFTPELACNLVNFVKQAFPENHNFGDEREQGKFESIIASLYNDMYGQVLYPTPMAKAAHLLYFVIKDHPFENGNKRIAVFLFCIFLEMHAPTLVEKTIGYVAMPVLALLIAASDPQVQKKEMMVNLIMKLFQLPE